MNRERVAWTLQRVKSTGLSFGLFLGLLVVWTVIGYLFGLGNGAVAVGSYAIITLSVVASGFYNSYTSQGKGWLSGLVGGGLLLLAIGLFGLAIMRGSFDVVSFAQKCPLYLVISMISGIIGINMK
jgi:putative membrane protein (TIGR04086 family)